MIPRFNIQFEVPPEIAAGFPRLLNNARKHIIRQSIRSALTPARIRLKANTMAMTREAKYSSGATSRSLTMKYRQAASNPNRFYGYVGVHRHYMEAILRERPQSPYEGLARHRQVFFGIRRRNPRPGQSLWLPKWQPREVRSRYKRSVSKDTRRRPSKYLHLIEFGFTHFSGKRFPGYHFVEKSIDESRQEAIQIFRDKCFDHFRRAFR